MGTSTAVTGIDFRLFLWVILQGALNSAEEQADSADISLSAHFLNVRSLSSGSANGARSRKRSKLPILFGKRFAYTDECDNQYCFLASHFRKYLDYLVGDVVGLQRSAPNAATESTCVRKCIAVVLPRIVATRVSGHQCVKTSTVLACITSDTFSRDVAKQLMEAGFNGKTVVNYLNYLRTFLKFLARSVDDLVPRKFGDELSHICKNLLKKRQKESASAESDLSLLVGEGRWPFLELQRAILVEGFEFWMTILETLVDGEGASLLRTDRRNRKFCLSYYSIALSLYVCGQRSATFQELTLEEVKDMNEKQTPFLAHGYSKTSATYGTNVLAFPRCLQEMTRQWIEHVRSFVGGEKIVSDKLLVTTAGNKVQEFSKCMAYVWTGTTGMMVTTNALRQYDETQSFVYCTDAERKVIMAQFTHGSTVVQQFYNKLEAHVVAFRARVAKNRISPLPQVSGERDSGFLEPEAYLDIQSSERRLRDFPALSWKFLLDDNPKGRKRSRVVTMNSKRNRRYSSKELKRMRDANKKRREESE